MNANDFMRVTLKWDVPNASGPVINIYNFQVASVTTPSVLQVVGSDIADAFIARYVDPLLPYQASVVGLTEIELRSYNNASEIYTRSGVLATGEGGTNMMPPFVTFNIRETRFAPTIRNGRIALPGIILGSGDGNGRIAPSVVTAVNAILEGWIDTEFTVEGPDYVFDHKICRLVDGLNVPPSLAVNITGYTLAPKYGTQNTRK